MAEIDKEKLRRAIVNRGMVVPIVEYDDGTQDWGVPGLLMEPIEAWKRLQAGASDNVARMQQGLPFDPQSAGDAFAVTGAAAMGSAVPQAARMVGRQTRPAQTAARYADDALTMEEVSPGQGFGSGAGTPATNWTPFSRAYPRAEDSPTWPQSWGETASAAEKAAFAEREYLHNLWREQMNARWSPDWDRPIVEREVMDAYPGLGEAMRRADATFESIRKGTPQGADPWASDPYAWFNRPHELGSPDLTEADVAAHVAKSKPIGAYVTSGAGNMKGPRPELGAVYPKAEAMGSGSSIAETALDDYNRFLRSLQDDPQSEPTIGPSTPGVDPNQVREAYEAGLRRWHRGVLSGDLDPYGPLDGPLGDDLPAVMDALRSASGAAGRNLEVIPRSHGSQYGHLKTPTGDSWKVRVADHGNQTQSRGESDFNIAPGEMTPDEFIRLLPTIYANPKEVAALGAALTGERHGMRSALADDKLIAIVKKYGIAGAASLYGVSELDLMEAMQEQGL